MGSLLGQVQCGFLRDWLNESIFNICRINFELAYFGSGLFGFGSKLGCYTLVP